MTKSISLKKLRPKLPKIMDEIDSKMDRFIVTKRGKPIALMMSMDDYESLLETLNILSDRKLMRKIRQAENDIKKGNFKTLEEVEKELDIV
ncbi:MAG: type II toxin-antitoxin system Phd/YefM family antitoxin [Candidatus Omnitrophota bacterium]